MASTDYELPVRTHNGEHQDVNEDQTSQDDHIRSWLHATTASARQASLSDDNGSQEEISINSQPSQSQPEAYELLHHGTEPPPYAVHDPAKDLSGTQQFELDDNNSANARLYVPIYLRTWMFVIFTFVFAAMLVAVEVMYQISNRNRGLGTQLPSRHYLWTYGPTLFLSVVAALWGQVEYRVKQLMPWKVLTKGPAPAERVLLMDYVSQLNVTAWIESLKAKHYAVSLVITGSVLIKVAIIVSTALFSLETRRMFREGAPMQLKDTFTSFSSYGNHSFIQPVLTAVGVSQYNLTYPPGTSASIAVQSFQPVHNVTDTSSIVFAEVDVFSADLSCEAAIVSQVSDAQCSQALAGNDCNTVNYNLTISSRSCTTNATQISATMNDTDLQYYGSVTAASCIGQPTNTNVLRYTVLAGHQSISYTSGARNATFSTALICQPTYQLCRVPVALNLDGSISNMTPSNSSCSSIADVSGWDIGTAVIDSLQAAANSPLIDFSSPQNTSDSVVNFDAYFSAMNTTTVSSDVATYLNANYLEASARRLFSITAAQIAKSHLTKSTSLQIQGAIVAHEERLFVRRIPLRILESIFATLIAIALVALLLRPSASTPCDVSTVAGVATVMARSPSVSNALQGLGMGKHSDMTRRLTGKNCHSVINTETEQPVFRLVTTAGGEVADGQEFGDEKIDWWHPFGVTIYARVGLAFLAFALIAALEAVYQHSLQEHGLGNVDEPSHARYAWTLVPAFLMTVVQTAYHMVDFSTRVLQPYDSLRRGQEIADKSINLNYLAHVTPTTIWTAFSHKHFSVFLTATTMLLAPTLTVVASGLYITIAVEGYHLAPVGFLSLINNTAAWNHPNNTNHLQNGDTVSTLITEANMSYPKWTYDGYVFPSLDTDSFLNAQFGTVHPANTTSVRVAMPAVYAGLNCTHASPNVTFNENATTEINNVTVPVPLGCGAVCAETSPSAESCDTSNSSVFRLGFLMQDESSPYGIVHIPSSHGQAIPDHCPQLALLYGLGTVKIQGGSDIINLTLDAAVCSPVVYQVLANITFTLPSFTIQSVEPDMSTREVVASGGSNKSTLPLHDYLPPTDWGVQSFFGGLVPGREGNTWNEFVGAENFSHFSDHVDNLYSIIYSQWLNLNGRVSPPTDAEALDAMIMNPMRMRLQQSAISTRILEGLLAAMTICVVAAFIFMDTRNLVASNPCCIGAMAALLAEREIVKSIPEGAEWYDRNELRRKRVFSDYRYTMRWWEGIGGTKRYGIDVGDPDDVHIG